MNKFKKENDYLICIDSDGSAIDTMTEKHKQCFGPEAVKVWNLENIEDEFMQKWNKVNLYSSTRGINRFKGLVKTFVDLKNEGYQIPEIKNLKQWTENTKELSNPALKKEIENNTEKEDLKLALKWSQQVNEEISKLEKDNSKVFENVIESMRKMSKKADLAVVSSANHEALMDEWGSYNILKFVKTVLGQEAGSKADNIAVLEDYGYSKDKILMIGDAPGDLSAAEANQVLFYPIVPSEEAKSWRNLVEQGLDKFFAGQYKGQYEDKLIKEYKNVLK